MPWRTPLWCSIDKLPEYTTGIFVLLASTKSRWYLMPACLWIASLIAVHVGGVPHTIACCVKGFLLWGSSGFPCQMDGRPSLWPAEHHCFVRCRIVSREQLPGDALCPHCSHFLRGGFIGLFDVEQQHHSVSSNKQPPRCHWSVFLGWWWLKFST